MAQDEIVRALKAEIATLREIAAQAIAQSDLKYCVAYPQDDCAKCGATDKSCARLVRKMRELGLSHETAKILKQEQ